MAGLSIHEDIGLLEEFLGPSISYCESAERFKDNPMLLNRNLRRFEDHTTIHYIICYVNLISLC